MYLLLVEWRVDICWVVQQGVNVRRDGNGYGVGRYGVEMRRCGGVEVVLEWTW